MDLNGEFTSRSQDKNDRTVSRRQQWLAARRTSQKMWRTDSEAAYALMCNMAGRAKEMVLPEPVWEIATTSRPLRAMGHAWH